MSVRVCACGTRDGDAGHRDTLCARLTRRAAWPANVEREREKEADDSSKRSGWTRHLPFGLTHVMDPTADADAPADEAPVRTITDVQRENAEWVANAEKEVFDESVEAAALTSMFAGDSVAAVQQACSTLNQSPKWDEAQRIWSTALEGQTSEQLGKAVRSVVDELEAPHLKPSGIQSRLLGGVPAACFGLFTLLQSMNQAAAAREQAP